MPNIRSFDEMMAEIKSNYEFHKTEAAKYFELLNRGGSVSQMSDLRPTAMPVAKAATVKQAETEIAGATFEEEVINILKDGTPRTGRQLSADYFNRTKKEYDRKEFTSRLAILKKNKGTIKNVEYLELPVEVRYWWGLPEWYEGDKLKNEYKEKIFKTLGMPMRQSLLE